MPTNDAPPPLSAAEIAAMRARCEAATEGEWFWNSYSRVDSAPMCQRNINEVELPHEDAGSPWAEDGNYPEPWKSLDKELNPTVCWVPPNHGDTATGRHKADAILIAHARTDLPRLLDELERARALLEALTREPDGKVPEWLDRPAPFAWTDLGAFCVYCEEEQHAVNCPWVNARSYLRAVQEKR